MLAYVVVTASAYAVAYVAVVYVVVTRRLYFLEPRSSRKRAENKKFADEAVSERQEGERANARAARTLRKRVWSHRSCTLVFNYIASGQS